MPAPSASDRIDPLTATVHAALSERLDPASGRPVALAFSGGGDSMALLALAVDWASARGRRILALTVDHGLNPDSARWSAFARDRARRLGADWLGLSWTGEKPARGVSEAARLARHRLIAEAARRAGARVALFGHTADDVQESQWMRAHGSTVGRMSDWSPSPVWPEGRGLMLARPLLGVGRAALRQWLIQRDLDWIDDPANENADFLRARARMALRPFPLEGDGEEVAHSRGGMPAAESRPLDGRNPGQPISAAGALVLSRDAGRAQLAAAVVCGGGGARLPRRDRLAGLADRLRSGQEVVGALCGARIQAQGDRVLIAREAGERRRGGLAPLILTPGEAGVWDGRFEITCDRPGRVDAVAGHAGRLSRADRVLLTRLPAAVRPAVPVLFRDGDPSPVLAWRAARVRCLVPSRFALAVGRARTESQIEDASVGEIAPNILSHPGDGAPAPERVHSRT